MSTTSAAGVEPQVGEVWRNTSDDQRAPGDYLVAHISRPEGQPARLSLVRVGAEDEPRVQVSTAALEPLFRQHFTLIATHLHCWHEMGERPALGPRGTTRLMCCHCPARARQEWERTFYSLNGHGPYVQRERIVYGDLRVDKEFTPYGRIAREEP